VIQFDKTDCQNEYDKEYDGDTAYVPIIALDFVSHEAVNRDAVDISFVRTDSS
jgi:hypothetical protein